MNDAVLQPKQDTNSEAEMFALQVLNSMSNFTQAQKREIIGIIHSNAKNDLSKLIELRTHEIKDIESNLKDLLQIHQSY